VKCIAVQDEFEEIIEKTKKKMFEGSEDRGRKKRLLEKVEINVSRWLY